MSKVLESIYIKKWKKRQKKDANHLKNNKSSLHSKGYKKDIEKGPGRVMKNEKYKKCLTTKM